MTQMSRTLRSALAVALTALAPAGCGSMGRTLTPSPFADAQFGPQKLTVHVDNLNFNEATIWLISSTGRRRLGIAGGKNSTDFTIPWTFSDRVQLEIDLLAGPRCTTDTIIADPGDILQMQVESDFGATQGCR